MTRCALALFLFIVALAGSATQPRAETPMFDKRQLDGAQVSLPTGPARATVFLFLDGDAAAYGPQIDALRAQGLAVLSLETAKWTPKLEATSTDCLNLAGDMETIGYQVGRMTGNTQFAPPIVAGIGPGGALAIDLLSHMPLATFGGVIAIDPDTDPLLKRQICGGSMRDGAYHLPSGDPPAPLTVVSTRAPSQVAARLQILEADGVTFARTASELSRPDALVAQVRALVEKLSSSSDLPLTELPAKPSFDTLAIVISGDGGWRDLDRTIAGKLQESGVPAIGLDALRFFWSKRTPAETAKAITEIVDKYTLQWNVTKVVLIGYSFGADVIPATYPLLPDAVRSKVVMISLLGLANAADWEVTVAGWLGGSSSDAVPTAPDIARLPPGLVQCFYGQEETDSACPSLKTTTAEVISTTGGHHFDGDYDALAKRILAGLSSRLSAAAARP